MSCWSEGTRDQCLAGVRAQGINVLMLALKYAPHCFFVPLCEQVLTPLGPVVDKQCDDDCGASHLLVCQFVKTKSTDLSMYAYIICASYVVSLRVITDEVNYFTTEQL